MSFVLDASMTMAWCFPDEADASADAVLDRLRRTGAVVPVVWPLEVANTLLVGERRQRLAPGQAAHFIAFVEALPITVDSAALQRALGPILALAREQHLASYDAAYLDLAMMLGLPIASRDGLLRSAARRVGVQLVQ